MPLSYKEDGLKKLPAASHGETIFQPPRNFCSIKVFALQLLCLWYKPPLCERLYENLAKRLSLQDILMTPNKQTMELGTEPIGKLLFKYSLPAVAGMVVASLYNVVDSIFIGRGVGALAISGLAITFPVMNLTFALGLLVGMGGAAVSSIRLGEKDFAAADNVLGITLKLSLINGAAFGLISLLILDPLLILFGASRDTLPYARDFMQIILLGLPVTYAMFNLNHVMRSSGYPRKAMLSLVMTVAVNIILAPIFIFILDWGIRGAAFATLLAQTAGLLWVLRHFLDKGSTLHFKPGIYTMNRSVIKNMMLIGMSPFLVNVTACLVVVLINTGVQQYGSDLAVGAFGIINRVTMLMVMIVVGLTQGMQPILGYNYGAKQLDRVKLTLRYGIIVSFAITTFGFVIFEIFPRAIAAAFTTDETLISLSVTGLHIVTAAFPLVGPQIVISNFFQSIGRARLAIFLALSRQVLYLIPCLLLLPGFLGLDGIWLGMPISDALAFLTSVTLLLLGKRRFEPRPKDV